MNNTYSFLQRWFGVLRILLLVFICSACGNSTPPPIATIAAAPLPAGWQQIDLPQTSLALPPQWAVTAAEDIDPSAAIAEAVAQNPQLAPVLERGQIELASGKVQLIAYDLDPAHIDESGYPANIRIGSQTYDDLPTLQEVSDANEQDLKATAGFSEVQRASIQVGDHTATRLTSKLQINDSIGTPRELALEQYLLIQGKDVYIITFTTPVAQQERYRATYDQILATLRFK